MKEPFARNNGVRPLAVYSDRKYLRPGAAQIALLSPAWGPPELPPASPDRGVYEVFADTGQSIVTLVAPTAAEVFVLPGYWVSGEVNEEAHQMAHDARIAGKPFALFFFSDSEERIPIGDAIIFRTSFRRSRKQPNIHALAAPGLDLIERHCAGELPLRVKTERPTVSFCGSTTSRDEYSRTRLRAIIYKIRSWFRPRQYLPWLARDFGNQIRMKTLESVEASWRVAASFVTRQRFMNGIDINNPEDQERGQRARVEYVENLLNSDYVLCPRGTGNFSFRFYETLCCGRIPVVIDTDYPLPYSEWINWREYCVWVPQAKIAQTADYIADFHVRLSPAMFLERQRAARDLWLRWLSPQGFHANLYRYFR